MQAFSQHPGCLLSVSSCLGTKAGRLTLDQVAGLMGPGPCRVEQLPPRRHWKPEMGSSITKCFTDVANLGRS